jgi:beta-N-acetylhexosaminidase
MSIFDSIKEKPFNLSDSDVRWVKDSLAGMTDDEKITQLFCLCGTRGTNEEVDSILEVGEPCGLMYRPFRTEEAVNFTKILHDRMKLPMLIPANLEKGGNGIVVEGTSLGSPTGLAATDDVESARKLGKICGTEGAAVGANWAFAPIIDIDYNFRNPITNTRTFGSCPERVREFGKAYVEEVQKCGLAASIKHFPGDGRDERDQHLVTSINDLSTDEWDKTYGAAYKASIDAGALTVMIGHIMQPAYTKYFNPEIKDEDILPGSLSKELMTDLLRGKLGFNGLISTDACTMAGFTIAMPRNKAVPTSIAHGADIFLFPKNYAEDVQFMKDGIRDGILTWDRVNEAVTRILALKAALGLNKEKELPTLESAMKIVGCDEHKKWAKEIADKCVTLVKEQKGVLPVTPDKYKRILYCPIEPNGASAFSGMKSDACDRFKVLLEKEGFEVTTFVPSSGMEGTAQKYMDVVNSYDAIIYCLNLATKSNQTTVRIEWAQPMGANCPHYIGDVPTLAVSIENPYHLIDMPRVKTFINAYASNQENLEAVVEKLVGRSEFKGKNPVDPFCGKWDTRL